MAIESDFQQDNEEGTEKEFKSMNQGQRKSKNKEKKAKKSQKKTTMSSSSSMQQL